jgi:hypothetical protein
VERKHKALDEMFLWVQDPLVMALVFAMYASGIANGFLYTFIPTLFVEAYGVKVSELGWLTTAAPLGNAVCCVLSGVLSDYLISKQWKPYRCRMLMQSIGTLVPALALLVLSCTESVLLAAVLVTLWMASHGFQTSGLTVMFHDVAGPRASELFAIGNVFSKFAGILSGPFTSCLSRRVGWGCILLVIMVHYVLSAIVLVSRMSRTEQTKRLFQKEEATVPTPAEHKTEQANGHTNGHTNGHANGEVNGHTNGHKNGVQKVVKIVDAGSPCEKKDKVDKDTAPLKQNMQSLKARLSLKVLDAVRDAAEHADDPGSPVFQGLSPTSSRKGSGQLHRRLARLSSSPSNRRPSCDKSAD